MSQTFVGIDVGKHYLDVHILPAGQSLRVDNDTPGIAQLLSKLTAFDLARITVESTGGYELPVVAELYAAGWPVVVVNPRQVRDFARATGRLAKTDTIDAQILARFGELIRPPLRPAVDETVREIKDLVARRKQLLALRGAETSRTEHARQPVILRSLRRTLKVIEEQILLVEQAIATLIQNSPVWRRTVQILQSVPGLGECTAAALVAALPELGALTRRQVAALAGVAPINRDSGMLRGKRMTGGGRASVRLALFMPTLVAIRHNPVIRDFYLRLLAGGKAKMTAVIACMHKLLTIVNAMIRDNRTWTLNPA